METICFVAWVINSLESITDNIDQEITFAEAR